MRYVLQEKVFIRKYLIKNYYKSFHRKLYYTTIFLFRNVIQLFTISYSTIFIRYVFLTNSFYPKTSNLKILLIFSWTFVSVCYLSIFLLKILLSDTFLQLNILSKNF